MESAGNTEDDTGGKPLRVLVVDDSEPDARLNLRELQRSGYALEWIRVQTANELSDALARQPWDVVLSDYSMPAFTGIEALELVRARDPDIPFILISGTVGEEFAVRAIHAGANDYLLKDRLTRLAPAIERALREATGQRERKRTEAENTKLEAQLQQAQKLESVGRLAGGVAHDFNNMLGVILGHIEMALEQVDPALPLYADLEQIRNAASRSANLTRQLLAFARRQPVSPTVLDLNETVAGMLKMLQRLLGEDINLVWKPQPELWYVKMDPTQVDQILANLCANARDAMPDVGKITIETRNCVCKDDDGIPPGHYVKLAVSDTGRGMDKETLACIFEPFFTTKELGKGTGLGLATVYGIVQQNNGFLIAESEPGKGATFKIFLPRDAAKTLPPEVKVPVGADLRGHETILLVEDEPAILKLTTKMLEQLGYEVLPSASPDEAIRMARARDGDIHLLITDVVMPEMNGRDLAGHLASSFPGLRHIFMSGYTANVITDHGVANTDMGFIQKPFTKKDLAAKVRAALDRE